MNKVEAAIINLKGAVEYEYGTKKNKIEVILPDVVFYRFLADMEDRYFRYNPKRLEDAVCLEFHNDITVKKHTSGKKFLVERGENA